MHIITKSHKYIGLILSVATMLLITDCTDMATVTTPYDPDYKGDYSLTAYTEGYDFYLFEVTKISIEQGDDKYVSFSAQTDPPGAIDTISFRYEQCTDTIGFYFLEEFSGTVHIFASRKNGVIDTFSFEIETISPFSIAGNESVILQNHYQYSLSQSNSEAGENVKRVYWYIDDELTDSTLIDEPFDFSFYEEGSFSLSAQCVDWKGNRIEIAPLEISTVESDLQLLSVRSAEDLYSINDSVQLVIRLKGRENDSANLHIALEDDTLSSIVTFSTDTVTLNTAIFLQQAGVITFSCWLSDLDGVATPVEQLELLVVSAEDYTLPIVTDILTIPSDIYRGQSVSLTIIAAPSISDSPIEEYIWSFEGENTEDTVTTVSSISKTFSEDVTVTVQVIDEDGTASREFTKDLIVGDVALTVTDVLLPEQNLYIGEPFTIIANGTITPAGTVDSFEVMLQNEETSLAFGSGDASISITLNEEQYGSYDVYARVMDSTGNWCDYYESETINVDKGVPIIDSFDLPETVWWKNSAAFKLFASDPNDKIKTVIIDWDDGYTDTIEVNSSTAQLLINHTFEELRDHEIAITVRDSYNFDSQETKTVEVEYGTPSVRIAPATFNYASGYNGYAQTILIEDTLYSPMFSYRHGSFRSIYINADADDPNGLPLEYAIELYGDDSTALDWHTHNEFLYNPPQSFSPDSPPVRVVLLCKNSDDLIGTDTFFVKLEESTLPSVVFQKPLANDTLGEFITLEWNFYRQPRDISNLNASIKVFFNYSSADSSFLDSLVMAPQLLESYKITGDLYRTEIIMPYEAFIPEGSIRRAKLEVDIWNELRQVRSRYINIFLQE